MTSRRKKTKLMEQGLRLLIVVVFFPIYYMTHSYTLAAISSGVVLGIVLAIALVRKREDENRLKSSGITDIDKMKGTQFTTYLKTLFERLGYSVEMTKARGNYGADLVLTKEGKKIVVQAKRHSRNVSVDAVQEVEAAIAYYGANEAWVVSNQNYTQSAHDLASSNHVRLINRNELIDMIVQGNVAR